LHTNGTVVRVHEGVAEAFRHGQVQFIPAEQMQQVYADIASGVLAEQTERQVDQHHNREARWRSGAAASLRDLLARPAPAMAERRPAPAPASAVVVASASMATELAKCRAILGRVRWQPERTLAAGEGRALC
jgi:hypothetical protein